MDAKKLAEYIKNRKPTETKAFKFTFGVTAGLCVFSIFFGLGFLSLYQWYHSRPYWSRKKLLQDYYSSEDYRIAEARYHGLLPPPKDVIERIEKYKNSAEQF